MAQLVLRDVTFGFGGPPLLDAASLSIERGERVALVGRNGAGKSTLLRLIGGEMPPESGEIRRASDSRLGALWQDVPRDLEGTVYEVAASGLGDRGRALARFLALSERADTADALAELEKIQHQIDAFDGWEFHREVERIITKLSLTASAKVADLSAGVKRRTLLARALAGKPDLLLLDEPTNHLDVDSVLWLEEFLERYDGTVVFISHDRRFLRRVATRIVDVDRGTLRSYDSDYDRYLERKNEVLETEAKHLEALNKKLAEEEAWLQKGTRARRTRNEGRVRALMKLREERRAHQDSPGRMAAQAQQADRSGRLVIETVGLGFRFPDQPIVRDLSVKIFRGDRIGILGPNGVGKTTLLRLLLGELEPTSGSVRHGTKLEVAYFDQIQDQLVLDQSIADNVGDGNDTITIGEGKRHIYGYLQDFLFTPEQARAKVGSLSGGERNRVLLAKLFTRPANVLVLDEPTNDLDIESLELLEEILTNFEGAVLLVSHDREFVDNVVTSSLVFEDGNVREFVGGYEEFMRERAAAVEAKPAKKKSGGKVKSQPEVAKLSYREQKELEALPAEIERLETEQQTLHETMAAPTFYQQGGDAVAEASRKLETIEAELARCYERWEQLDERS